MTLRLRHAYNTATALYYTVCLVQNTPEIHGDEADQPLVEVIAWKVATCMDYLGTVGSLLLQAVLCWAWGVMPWVTAEDLHRCRNLSPGIWYTCSSINECRLLWIGYPPPWILILVGAKWSRSLIILSQYQYSMYSMYVWLIIKCIILKLCSTTLKSHKKTSSCPCIHTRSIYRCGTSPMQTAVWG